MTSPVPCSAACRPADGIHVFATRAPLSDELVGSTGHINNDKAVGRGVPPCCLPTGTKVRIVADEPLDDPDTDPFDPLQWATWTVQILDEAEAGA